MIKTKISVITEIRKQHKKQTKILFIAENGELPADLDKKTRQYLQTIIDNDFKGKTAEILTAYVPTGSTKTKVVTERYILAGTGAATDKTSERIQDNLRRAGGAVSSAAGKAETHELVVYLSDLVKKHGAQAVEYISEGMLLGDYRFTAYKSKRDELFTGIRSIVFLSDTKTAEIKKAIKRAQVCAEAVIAARDMAHEPGNRWTPEHFAAFARNMAAETSLYCTVLDKKQMEKQGLEGILTVNKGSDIPPTMVILDYKPDTYKTTILLVGKGLTFDSGGISLKPAFGMQEMKYDMCGGAAVLATMQAVSVEKPENRVVAIVPATENLSGGSAVKPGDIITHYNGVTSEIVNTDAEGRLILADALSYGVDKYKPDCIIDLATLTGAVIVALGHHRSGLVSNNDELAERVIAAGERCGEPVWRLPLDDAYSKQIESDVADIKNVGGKPAGTITAAAYLHKFIKEIPWVHLDIAGTAWEFTEKEYIPKGPSGVGVRTLITLLRDDVLSEFGKQRRSKSKKR